MQETELQAALARNLDGAFETVVLHYQDRLYAFALRLLRSPQDAEEAVQDAFVRAYGALQGYAPDRIYSLALRPWLYQIVLNVVRNRTRTKRPTLTSLDATDGQASVWEPADDEQKGPSAAWERTEARAELAAFVAALPDRYRAAVVLRHIADLPYAEVAQVLDQPVGTAKANVHRGIQVLRTRMIAQMNKEQV